MSFQTVEIIITIVKTFIVFVALMSMVPVMIWLERKVIADIQVRIGPNRAGPFGILQPIADAIKLFLKEDIIARDADKLVYFLAPAASIAPAIIAFAVVPFGDQFTMFGHRIVMQVADINIGILYILALSSLAVYGIVLAGWSSNNKYSLLGGIRSSAQMISYELPLGVALVGPILLSGSLTLRDMVDAQARAGVWFIAPQFLAFVCYIISGFAETNRAPFDLPEAEQELTAGYHTEYSSFRFAMFFMAEYINMVTVTAIATTIFLGGWRGPFSNIVILQPVWFLVKVFALLYVMIWVRGTLPRVRYDKLMRFGWKILLPISLINLLITAAVKAFAPQSAIPVLSAISISLAILVAVALAIASARSARLLPSGKPEPKGEFYGWRS
ncbi:MAG: NADH-quinone oxidoreductase subunit NuoH [Armatimonadota bacterium]|nr:NADH-quinone oxidoreductase subunit NuoH [Armatimonadota bacterium]